MTSTLLVLKSSIYSSEFEEVVLILSLNVSRLEINFVVTFKNSLFLWILLSLRVLTLPIPRLSLMLSLVIVVWCCIALSLILITNLILYWYFDNPSMLFLVVYSLSIYSDNTRCSLALENSFSNPSLLNIS